MSKKYFDMGRDSHKLKGRDIWEPFIESKIFLDIQSCYEKEMAKLWAWPAQKISEEELDKLCKKFPKKSRAYLKKVLDMSALGVGTC